MRDKIIALEEDLRQAMLSNNVKVLNGLIDDSLVFIAPNGMIVTKPVDLDAHITKIQKISELTASEQHIQLDNNFAVVTVKMNIAGTYAETDISGQYRYLRIWAKRDDGFKIIAGSVVQIPE